jgi:hypothetical protein
MNKLFTSVVLVVGIALLSAQVTSAAYMTFESSTYSKNVGDIVSVPVIIDTENVETRAADIYVTYDSNVLEPVKVQQGTFYPKVINNTKTGQVYLAVYEDNPTANIKGRGTVATIDFRLKTTGSATVKFLCDSTKNTTTSEIIEASANSYSIIECSKYTTATINVLGATTTTTVSNPTTAPAQVVYVTATPAPVRVVTTNTTTSVTNQQLPRSGAAENVAMVFGFGSLLSLIGYGLKFIQK